MSSFYFPLSFESGITEKEVVINIQGKSYVLYFNLNIIELSNNYYLGDYITPSSNLYISCYSINKTTIYFGSLRCVIGSYLNSVDNGFPYKFFFLDNSGKSYTNVTFDSINGGINLYCTER